MVGTLILSQQSVHADWHQYVLDRQWFVSKIRSNKRVIAGVATVALMLYFMDVNPARWIIPKKYQYDEKSITHAIEQLEEIYTTVNSQYQGYADNSYIKEAAKFLDPKPVPEPTTAPALTAAILSLDTHGMERFCRNGITDKITWWQDRLKGNLANSDMLTRFKQPAIQHLKKLGTLLHCPTSQ